MFKGENNNELRTFYYLIPINRCYFNLSINKITFFCVFISVILIFVFFNYIWLRNFHVIPLDSLCAFKSKTSNAGILSSST